MPIKDSKYYYAEQRYVGETPEEAKIRMENRRKRLALKKPRSIIK